MVRPVLMAVDDEPAALRALEGELGKRYGADYQVVCADTPEVGLRRLERLTVDGGQLALVLADQWMPSMTGVEFLGHARRLHPGAQRVVLINWGDRSTAEPILQASALGQIDDWTAKPWGPGDEFFHQAISGFLNEWARLHRPRFEVFQVVGDQWAPRSHEIRDLLSRNSIPFGFYPVDSQQGRTLLEGTAVTSEHLPVVVLFDRRVLVDPSNAELAQALGIKTRPEASTYDVTVIGAGPAGLAAAMYGASEGLGTAVLEHEALGGQAGTSSMIRNYLGFPRGVSGAELAQRAYEQAWILGADFIYGPSAIGLRSVGPDRVVALGDGAEATSRAVILATGVTWRRLGVPSLEALVGAGVFYGRRLRSPGHARPGGACGRWGQLRRPGRGVPGQVCGPGQDAGAGRLAGRGDVRLPGPGDRGSPQHRRPLPDRGRRRPRQRPSDRPDPQRPDDRDHPRRCRRRRCSS
jgi:thioredoxin reductase (NADPH)